VILDQSHRKWILGTGAAAISSIIVYAWFSIVWDRAPRGGSALGLLFGSIGFGLMLFAGLLGARQRVPGWRVGRMQTWMRAHLWLGLLSLPIILLHTGFSFGNGVLTRVLMTAFLFTIVSGVFGAAMQTILPAMMMRQVPLETIYDQIGSVRKALTEEAEQLLKTMLLPQRAAAAAGDAAPLVPRDPSQEVLTLFQDEKLRPFLAEPKGKHLLASRVQASRAFHGLRTVLPVEAHPALAALEEICEEQRQLNQQERLHWWMHGWLLVHVPVSYLVLTLGFVHALAALRY
jgi:hypothetical protein